jgi:hypothetical protein
MIKRREFIAGMAGVVAWPVVAQSQGERMRRIGVLMAFDESDPDAKARLSGFTQRLAELGWTDSRNLRIDVRWASGSLDRMRMFARVGRPATKGEIGPQLKIVARTAHHGILLLVHQTPRRVGWQAENGVTLTFEQVVERLRAKAAELAGASTDAPQPEIAVIDVSVFAPKVAARKQKAATPNAA